MILVIDVSNTNSTLGVFDGDKLVANWRLSTLSSRTSDETGMLLRMLFVHSGMDISEIDAVVVSSVVPNVMYSLLSGIRKYLQKEPMVVRAGMKTGINLRIIPRKWGQTVSSIWWQLMNSTAALPLWWITARLQLSTLSAKKVNFSQASLHLACRSAQTL